MSINEDPMTIRADLERRLELAGVDPYDRHGHDLHRHALQRHRVRAPALGVHPLAAFVTRLVRARDVTRSPRRRHEVAVPSGPPHDPSTA